MGRIILCSIKNLAAADVKIFAARVKPTGLPQGWIHVPQLAPSAELFSKYVAWRHKNMWPGMWAAYKKQFVTEMRNMTRYLTRIEEHLQAGRDVAIACYCHDVKHCHRGILGEYFAGLGYQVIWG
jgi:uncharacterized protein YeaO (DUF488 family)